MSGAAARILPDGRRLHLHHGPIDLIVSAEDKSGAASRAALDAAAQRFETVLEELTRELPGLRTEWSDIHERPNGSIARRMFDSVAPHAGQGFVTPMAAVAGAVAEEILDSMTRAAVLERAFVNNGGDIAFHLAAGRSCRAALADLNGVCLGNIEIDSEMRVRGIATSGRGGRSFSLGIADSVTVLARTAAVADAAATLIANAVDLPGSPAVNRCPAERLDADSDLADISVVTDCGWLTDREVRAALNSGAAAAEDMHCRGLIEAAALFLRGSVRIVGGKGFQPADKERRLVHA